MGRGRGTGPLTALVVVAVLAATTTVLAAAVPSPDRPAAATTLVDVADRVGLDTRHGAFRWGSSSDPAAMMGGGVCWLDADADGWQDLYVVSTWSDGEHQRWLDEGGLPTSTLYRNVEGRFVDVGTASGTALQVRGQGCLAADLDGDGHVDLLVTSDRTSTLLWNDGDGTFTADDGSAGLHVSGWHAGAAADDVDGDGRLDVVLTGYVDRNTPLPAASGGFPRSHAPVADLLLHNLGPGEGARARFVDVSSEAGLDVDGPRYGLGATFVDVDHDGDRDLLVANDTDPDRLYRNDSTPGHPRLVDVASAVGVDDDGSGMGTASGDLDGDGMAELLVTNMGEQRHALHQPEAADPWAFVDGRATFGVPAFGEGLTGWGIGVVDLDADGHDDVLVGHGAVPMGTDPATTAQPLLAYAGTSAGLRLVDGGWGLEAVGPHNARGTAVADYDNDGDPDVAMVGVGEPLVLLQNQGRGGAALRVQPEGRQPGTRVVVTMADGTVAARTVTAGSSYLSTEDPRPLFGLGTADRVGAVEVTWPDGHSVVVEDVPTDRVLDVGRDGSTVLARFEPQRDVAAAAVPCADRSAEAPSAVARWIDVALEAIRHDLPDPTAHARTLYHLSAAMWDSRAALVEGVSPVLADVDASAVDAPTADVPVVAVDRRAVEAAIAQAAHDVLASRYGDGRAGDHVARSLPLALAAECLRPDDAAARAVGSRVAAAVLGVADGDGSADRSTHQPANRPLVVRLPGADMDEPDAWQPLQLDRVVTQNGIAQPAEPQAFLGYGWGGVATFALPDDPDGVPIDPGPPPRLDDPDGGEELRRQLVDVLRASSQLDPADGVVVDAGPGGWGNNPLGTDEGSGHPVDPTTGRPWTAQPVLRGDLGRVLAEFWADGPHSETPPGHWNVIARAVTDAMSPAERLLGGSGPSLDRLTWEVSLHLVLNGALHDAAVAAWGVKTAHDSPRPISLIRHLGGMGQSSDPDGAAYHPDGLPLVDDLVEVASAATTAPGGRHEGLGVGRVVVRAWAPRVDPDDPAVRWIHAEEWVPYQQATFVSPAFAGYVSGHSTFSRAAAEVMTAATGSPWFPGGSFGWTVPAGDLAFEGGPSGDVVLTWATYADAADQAGRSRIHGGIHIPADDHAGRIIGAEVGRLAWERALPLFAAPAGTSPRGSA